MWQTFFDVRNACQEHRLLAVPGVGAEDVLVPMIGTGAMLHDVTGRIYLADRDFRADPLPNSFLQFISNSCVAKCT